MTRFICVIVIQSFILMTLTNCPVSAGESGRIAFSKILDANFEIVVTDENGGNMVNLLDNPADDSMPAWSPDGRYIAFSILPVAFDREYRIMVMKADSIDLKEISKGDAPSWFDPAFAIYAINIKIS